MRWASFLVSINPYPCGDPIDNNDNKLERVWQQPTPGGRGSS